MSMRSSELPDFEKYLETRPGPSPQIVLRTRNSYKYHNRIMEDLHKAELRKPRRPL